MDLDTSCPDWRQRLTEGRSLVPDVPLINPENGEKAVRIFNRLRVPDIPGQPRLAEAGGDWFRDIVRVVFGSYDSEAGRRLIQEIFLLVPKKNAKSTYSAAVMMTAIIMNQRPNAELLLIAPTKEIADIAFNQARGMVKADPALDNLFHPQEHLKKITHLNMGSVLKVVAADTNVVTGVKATFILIDETHVFGDKSRATHVFTELRGAQAARPDGFLWQITTQSKTPPAGVFKAELQHARAVRDGKAKAPLLPVLYELPQDLAGENGWRDPDRLRMVNPNLGRSVNLEFIERGIERAEEEGAEALALFASQHANVEIGLALQSDRWPGADYWQAQGDRALSLETVIERSEVVTVGIDGGGLDDLLGFAVCGRDAETGGWMLWNRAWAHPIAAQRRKTEAPKYRDFERDGDLVMTDGLHSDVAEVAALVGQVEAAGKLDRVGLDPVGIGAVVDALQEVGIEYERLVAVTQGWKLSGAIKTTERELASGKLRHAGQPMMAWCVGNAKIEPRGNAILVTKQAAGRGKIDPLMATFNAIALMAMNPEPRGGDLQAWLDEPIMVV